MRCTKCDKEMVIEPVHAGRTVPCPWCRAAVEIPSQLDFQTAKIEGRKDESAGGALLAFAVVGLLTTCIFGVGLIPAAIVWWLAQGRIHRARDEGRPVDPLVAAARTIAIIAAVLGAIVLCGWIASSF